MRVISCPCLEKSTSRDILICQTEIKEGEMIVPYIANTESDRAKMLKAAGFSSLEDMWEKAGVRFPYPALEGIPEGKSEYEVVRHLEHLANMNATDLINFVGGGYYDHVIPSVVDSIVSRRRILYRLYPVPAGSLAGNASGDLRVSDRDVPPDPAWRFPTRAFTTAGRRFLKR